MSERRQVTMTIPKDLIESIILTFTRFFEELDEMESETELSETVIRRFQQHNEDLVEALYQEDYT